MLAARSFSVNDPILFVIVGIIIAVVVAQSVFFLVKSIKRAKAKGMDMSIIKKTITSSILFTIAPAVSILVGVIILSQALGIPTPWLRLSVIGSLSYETVAANQALSALGLDFTSAISSASSYVTVLWVMTSGIVIGLVLVPVFTKRIQKGVNKIGLKDKRWGEIFNTAMFLGMISAFLGLVFCDVTDVFKGETKGLVPVFVMLVSSLVMAGLGILSKKTKQRWVTDYALPISLVAGMASAIPFTAWLG